MSESDSSIPQKLADLAKDLSAIRKYIGFGSAIDLPFYHWIDANDPDAVLSDSDPEDARKEVLAAAAEFVEAVDTAERTLNTIPASVLEHLSAFSGVLWEMRTRRALKAIQDEISYLRFHSEKPELLLTMIRAKGKLGFEKMDSELMNFWNELSERIVQLQLFLDALSGQNPLISPQSVNQAPVSISNGSTESDGDSVVPPAKQESQVEINDNHPKGDELPPPKYDPNSADWILSETLCDVINIKATTIADYRKARKCGEDRKDEFGNWNVDCVGKFRRQVNSKGSVAYYRPAMSESYKARLTYAESQKRQKP